MRKLNKAASRVLDALCEGFKEPGDHRTLDNGGPGIMAVSAECIGQRWDGALFISVAHYFEQNGDLRKDPDMVFLREEPMDEKGPCDYYPMTFQQDIPPVYQEAIVLQGGKTMFRPRLLAQLVSFANGWMQNIKWQQGIKAKRAA
jgi:hypothetical protein